MAVVSGVRFFVVILQLVEGLQVFQTQRAKEALLHFGRAVQLSSVTGSHEVGGGLIRRAVWVKEEKTASEDRSTPEHPGASPSPHEQRQGGGKGLQKEI